MLDEAGRAKTRARQLSLFKGRKQRGIAPPSAREFALHCMVADAVRRWIMPGWRYTHLPMGEKRNLVTASRLKRMGTTAGWPDLMFYHCHGSVHFLELKRRGSKPTDEQRSLAEFLRLAGHGYNCVDSFDDAIMTLKNWGIVRSGIDVQ